MADFLRPPYSFFVSQYVKERCIKAPHGGAVAYSVINRETEPPAGCVAFARGRRNKGERGLKPGLLLVEYQVQPLASVELETGVAGDEGHPLGNGVGDDDVVRRVFVPLRLIDGQAGVSLHMFPF